MSLSLRMTISRDCRLFSRNSNTKNGAERVVFAFGPLGEAGQAAALAQGADAIAAAGEDLVRIGLMADIPDQPVARRVEHIMQRHRQLDDA